MEDSIAVDMSKCRNIEPSVSPVAGLSADAQLGVRAVDTIQALLVRILVTFY